MVLFDMHMMSCDGFQAAGKIRDRGCGRAALPVEKEAKSTFEGVNLDEILQAGEHRGIVAHTDQCRGEGADLPFSVSEGHWPHRSEGRVLEEIKPGEPVTPRVAVLTERFREPIPPVYPIPAPIRNLDVNLRPALDRNRRPPPRP